MSMNWYKNHNTVLNKVAVLYQNMVMSLALIVSNMIIPN